MAGPVIVKRILIFIIGICLGIVLSWIQKGRFPNFKDEKDLITTLLFGIFSSLLVMLIDFRFHLAQEITEKWKKEINKFFEKDSGKPLWSCNAKLSDEVTNTFLRKNWEITINELWGKKNEDLLNKLSISQLKALFARHDGFFDDRLTDFLQDGKVGFLFSNPECTIRTYAYWAKAFETSNEVKSLYATNFLLPSELFSDENIKETLHHAIAFNQSDVRIERKRLQIYTDDMNENNVKRSKEQFTQELGNRNYKDGPELLKIYEDIKSMMIWDPLVYINNKTIRPTPGDLYSSFFKGSIDLKWTDIHKNDVGNMYHGDYIVINDTLVLRYSKHTHTLDLICGEIVDDFCKPFRELF